MIKKDDELDKLEEDIRKLKVKYEMFFLGSLKMPPQHERHQIEVYIFELGKKKMRENSRRFRYNQLLSRYNQFREMWARKMREREEGPMEFRRRQAAYTPSATAPTPPPPPPPDARVTSPRSDPYVKVAQESKGEEVRRLYEEIEREHLAHIPIGRAIQPEDIAHAVLYFASEQASAVTGQVMSVDGGTTRGIFY